MVTHCFGFWTQGNTVILTIVDRFSKSVHFVSLPKLFSALETASWVHHEWPPLNFSNLEGFLSGLLSVSEFVLWLPSSYQWADRVRWIRIWRQCLIVSQPEIFLLGVSSCPGLNTCIIPWSVLSQVLLTSSVFFPGKWNCCPFCSVPSLPLLQGMEGRQLHSADSNQCYATRHQTPAPNYQPGQKVWFWHSVKEFIGPYKIDIIINSSVVKLKMPRSMSIHPTFHVSQLKPVSSRSLCASTS